VKPEIILALDVDTFDEAKGFVDMLYPQIKIFKIGSQLFTAVGPRIIEYVNGKGKDAGVFLDLKFFDIPNTVANAVKAAVRMNVKMLTLHILGDVDMLKEAKKAAVEEAEKRKCERPFLIGVTVLTSKDATSSDVHTLSKIGLESGLDGVVCSGREAGFLREKLGKDFVIVTPGIRPDGAAKDDQKRTVTVSEAIGAGSNFLVIGRPILKAADPLKAAKELLN
jgi:orotidine-5'-phosphate decarboxylase